MLRALTLVSALTAAVFTMLLCGCGARQSRSAAQPPTAQLVSPPDLTVLGPPALGSPEFDGCGNAKEYLDVRPGWRLRVTAPLVGAQAPQVDTSMREVDGKLTITADAKGFSGYETDLYVAEARSDGIAIRFLSGVRSVNGENMARQRPSVRLFDLPDSARYVRLVFAATADQAGGSGHKMAVVAAASMRGVEATSEAILRGGRDCEAGANVYCGWVPPGVGVVAEARRVEGGSESWAPLQ